MTGSSSVSPNQTAPQKERQTFVNGVQVKTKEVDPAWLLEATVLYTAMCCKTETELETLPMWNSEQ